MKLCEPVFLYTIMKALGWEVYLALLPNPKENTWFVVRLTDAVCPAIDGRIGGLSNRVFFRICVIAVECPDLLLIGDRYVAMFRDSLHQPQIVTDN